MKPKIKERWLAALRSGRYAQTTHSLRDDAGFCCLGVLCDVFDPDAWEHGKTYGGAMGVLPTSVVEATDLPDEDADVTVGERRTTLSNLNDEGYTFAEIAELIEAQL